MSMKLDSLEKLFIHELKDLYSAENQILETLPKMIDAAEAPELRQALKDHEKETREQVRRLEKIFRGLEYEPGGHRCVGMEGLLKEGEELIKEIDDSQVRDAALIAASQRVEHYEMAGYGVARAYAEKLAAYEAADLLQKSLDEEGAADRAMTRLAERSINFVATAIA